MKQLNRAYFTGKRPWMKRASFKKPWMERLLTIQVGHAVALKGAVVLLIIIL